MMMRGYLNPYHLSHSFMAGQSIGSDCVWKFGQLYGEGLFKCHHHLGQLLWPANQKQFFYEKLDNVWWEAYLHGQPVFTPFDGCSSSKVECTDHHLWAQKLGVPNCRAILICYYYCMCKK
jgi:hypothetical protein